MSNLINSIWKEIGSFSGFSGLIAKPNDDRSVSLMNLHSIPLKIFKSTVNGPSLSPSIESLEGENEDNNQPNDQYSLIREIITWYGLRIVHENDPSQSVVSFKENKFVLDSLHWHNILRIKHRAPPLSLSIGLCELAQDWANKLAHWDVFYHRNYKSIGENLILKCSSLHDIEVDGRFTSLLGLFNSQCAFYRIKGEQVTKYWYAEIDCYRFDLPPHLLHTRANQFTQMIWKGSRKFGIGKARSRSGKLIIVANYEPSGNIKEDFHANVLAPFEDFELDFIADNLIPKQRGKLNRVLGKQLRARRKAIWD